MEMSLLPMLFSEWWEGLDRPHRLLDQHFGLGLHPDQLLSPAIIDHVPLPRRNVIRLSRPRHELASLRPEGCSTIQADKDKFQVILDVQQFEPQEIDVKVVDKYVVVTAKHEEKRDEHGWISRQFMRKYLIPEQCDLDQVTSKLSSDGILSITAPRKGVADSTERVITIEHTGKPAVQQAGKSSNVPPAQKQKEEQQQNAVAENQK